jgi:RNA polymerase sigma-70 factor (ECF subfamily)
MHTRDRQERPSHSAARFDREGIVALIPRMRAFARCLCGDPAPADALVGAALSKARLGPGDGRKSADLEVWLLTLVRDEYASMPADPGTHGAAAGGALAGPGAPAVSPGVDDLGRALLKLPRDQREALALVEGAGLSCADAAAICGCATATIRVRLGRSRQNLLAILANAPEKGDRRIPDGAMASILAQTVRAKSRAVA